MSVGIIIGVHFFFNGGIAQTHKNKQISNEGFRKKMGAEIVAFVMRVLKKETGSEIDFCHEGFRKGREV